MDLKIEKGIRKPCFSTVATSSALREAQRHGDAREQHMGRVVVVRALSVSRWTLSRSLLRRCSCGRLVARWTSDDTTWLSRPWPARRSS